jgi:hypothetical protein
LGVPPLFLLLASGYIDAGMQYTGRLKAQRLEPTAVMIEIDEGRFRVVAGKRHLGSWPMDSLEIHRTSVYRFAFDIEGDNFEFFPEDPSAFANAAGAIVDLTDTKGRFGLKARIEGVSNA